VSARTPDHADAPDSGGLAVEVRRGEPTAEELAALIAVVSESYAVEVSGAVVDDTPAATPWSRSQRALRAPLRRDVAWGRFAG
jgi:hypothetical protein